MKEVQDNFSNNAATYAAYRPYTPDALFDVLYQHVSNFDTAWDCGTGNGQVAVKLAERFTTVYGTDISAKQLALAVKKDNIVYAEERAESTSLKDKSIDLITIGQALHWFDFDAFYAEARRVAKPGALIAAWTYANISITPLVDKVITHLYSDITRSYWDKERRYVDDEYKTISFPFEEIKTPQLQIEMLMTLDQLIGYLSSWSGVQHYISKEHSDPVALVKDDLLKAWGGAEKLVACWPLYLRMGKI